MAGGLSREGEFAEIPPRQVPVVESEGLRNSRGETVEVSVVVDGFRARFREPEQIDLVEHLLRRYREEHLQLTMLYKVINQMDQEGGGRASG